MHTFIAIIFIVAIIGFCCWLVNFLPLAQPFPQIIQGLLIILAIWLVLVAFGVLPGSLPSFALK